MEDFLKNGSWDGLNVTIPYKKTAYALCDSISPIARETGNLNTLLRRRAGTIFGAKDGKRAAWGRSVESVGGGVVCVTSWCVRVQRW